MSNALQACREKELATIQTGLGTFYLPVNRRGRCIHYQSVERLDLNVNIWKDFHMVKDIMSPPLFSVKDSMSDPILPNFVWILCLSWDFPGFSCA